MPLKLDLGSGPIPEDGFLGVDLASYPKTDRHEGVIAFDLGQGERWPFEDGSVAELHSAHLIEHIPALDTVGPFSAKDRLARFFEEAWRVAVLGARFTLRWPALATEGTHRLLPGAFVDPTHRRFIPKEQLFYWSAAGRRAYGVEHYGFHCNWVLEGPVLERYLELTGAVREHHAILVKHAL